MSTLYAIATEYREAALKLADLDMPPEVVADTLESIGGEIETKAQAVAYMVRSIEADAAAIKQWAQDAAERAKATQARADALRDYLKRNLEACGISKVEGPGVSIGFRKSSAVQIDEPGLVPVEFMRYQEPPPPSPDKQAIAAALKSGMAVPGAHIETRHNLTIK
jgi:hypothetical protein